MVWIFIRHLAKAFGLPRPEPVAANSHDADQLPNLSPTDRLSYNINDIFLNNVGGETCPR